MATRFSTVQLINGCTAMYYRKKSDIVDMYITNNATEIFYMIVWNLNKILRRKADNRSYRSNTFERLVNRDGYKCNCCGSTYNLTIDHIIPISKGGFPKSMNNLQLLCLTCNQKKSNKITKNK